VSAEAPISVRLLTVGDWPVAAELFGPNGACPRASARPEEEPTRAATPRKCNMKTILLAVAACSLASGCAAERWNGEVESWGSLRSVLREGDKSGKVLLSEVDSPFAVGIGALAGLEGEILIYDGSVWTSRADAQGRVDTRLAAQGDQAAFLALARVRSWRTFTTDRELTLADLDAYLGELRAGAGLGDRETLPFIVHGRVDGLAIHVLAGRCPYAPGDTDGSEPLRRTLDHTDAVLVGLYTDLPPGALTHHGAKTHVHALLRAEFDYAGHVDEARIPKGTTLLLPSS
jgi:alpha-acetolactate decarboxylase